MLLPGRTGTTSPTAWKATPCATPASAKATSWSRRYPDEVTGEPRATVNRLLRSGRTRLLPENPAYEPIETDEITIIGK
jgi:hypothetical protein